MRVVVQRVKEASVTVDDKVVSSIGNGLLIFLGITHNDTQSDIDWLTKKIVNLRIFNDSDGVMNRSLKDMDGQALVISQFTLHASTKKGNRPSYIQAAKPDLAIPLYEKFVHCLEIEIDKPVGTGIFGADMKVRLLNDGPVTISMDSQLKE